MSHWGATSSQGKVDITPMCSKALTVTDEVIVTLEKSRLPEPPRECHYSLPMMLEPLKRKRIQLVTPFKMPGAFISIECEDTTARVGISQVSGSVVHLWSSIGPDATQSVPCVIKVDVKEWATAMRLE